MTEPIIVNMLKTQMSYLTERQGLLAQNMSNMDTPGYTEQDLKKVDFAEMARSGNGPTLAMRTASGGTSMNGTLNGNTPFSGEKIRKSFEVTPTGNNVVLEEQMAKISDTGAQFQIASSLYKKFNSLYNTALGKSSS
jgi:flagellar basal-body rod protein FlgB